MSSAESAWGKERELSSRVVRDWTALTAKDVFSLSGRILPIVLSGALVFLLLGMAVGFPADVPAGFLRTGLVHLPMAWLSILLLVVIAFWSALGLVLETPLPFMVAQSLAPTGGMCAFLAIWTGAFWNKAAAGLWWAGSAREIAGLLLLVVYLLIVAIPVVIEQVRRADRIAALIALIGAAQVPLLFFVAELFCAGGVSSAPANPGLGLWSGGRELLGLLFLAAGFWLYATYVALLRLRCIIIERQAGVAV